MNEHDFTDSLSWTPAALDKLKRIPFFVRSQARQRIEEAARTQELDEVTADLVDTVRTQLGQ